MSNRIKTWDIRYCARYRRSKLKYLYVQSMCCESGIENTEPLMTD